MSTIASFIIVGCGGFIGAITRYGIQQTGIADNNHKWLLTMAINLAGCLLIGIAWTLAEHWQLPRWLTNLMIAGFLGGFTTFSSFSLDTVTLLQTGRLTEAFCYIGISVAGGLILCLAAMWGTGKLLSASV